LRAPRPDRKRQGSMSAVEIKDQQALERGVRKWALDLIRC
jgi:hypothetical protein